MERSTVAVLGAKTPPPSEIKMVAEPFQNRGGIELPKDVTPDRLRVPKPFIHPERYRSPTDKMVSPITRSLLARTRRRGGALLPPSMINPQKMQALN
ncbi:hypothetical protein MLD38_034730 [Melastoma candidum]|uniref:Uncharacterized protein n=1 Tax=Melastoma candidum TaxID=119954 RepID=A0ACB9MBH7_9MYRT|nr:hypothetical protein MLD38_034730 [Melastoma candidum]